MGGSRIVVKEPEMAFSVLSCVQIICTFATFMCVNLVRFDKNVFYHFCTGGGGNKGRERRGDEEQCCM